MSGLTLDALAEILLGGSEPWKDPLALAARLDSGIPEDWRNLAAVMVAAGWTGTLGITGGQGAGKSTLAAALVQASRLAGRRAAACSLDDFYLTRDERMALAQTVHPLFATRGVPGTHDVDLALSVLSGLTDAGVTRVPVFDKGRDDRTAGTEWRTVEGPVETIVFEGWCLGVPAEPAERLIEPVNQLERDEDADRTWRCHVNDMLGERYPPLWSRVDRLLYLQVPDMAAVRDWRAHQELALPESRRMVDAELDRFLAHYERLTLWMFETLPDRSEVVIELGRDHRIARVRRNF
ncbi:MAG: kinase [Pseudomonadales bacterium]|nr:kinase [Pseudomonadales bacterium]NIX08461.1 kinase [Pseudomonadales bacterium]